MSHPVCWKHSAGVRIFVKKHLRASNLEHINLRKIVDWVPIHAHVPVLGVEQVFAVLQEAVGVVEELWHE